ncbi:hypothetical protein HQ585_00240 [candidate division KSB1 bacterium]|nr:hypothetical protein [candidate division KSB1 bacterium]
MKRKSTLIGTIYFLCLLLVSVQFVSAQKIDKKPKPVFNKKLTYSIAEEEKIGKFYDGAWSKPEQSKSSRLLHYKTEKMISGKKKDVLFSKASGKNIFTGSGWLTVNKQAYVKAKNFEGPPYQVYEIYDLNGKLLSTVEFNKPNTFGWDGPYKSVIWTVKPYYYFDDGQFGGVDFEEGMFHIVNPSKNIYKEIPVLIPPIPIKYRLGVSRKRAYNSQTKDMFVLLEARSRWDVEDKKIAYVCLLIDENGNVLWRREKPTMTWSMMSPNGEYMVLFTEERGKDFEGGVEIIRRDGSTVSTINTCFSTSMDRFSEDMKLIGFREKHKRINIYDVQTGELLNTFTFNGFRPVKEIAINHQKNLLYVLRNYPAAFPEGNRYVNIYALDGSAKIPLWEFDMGAFNRKKDDYINPTHLSISNDGEEITAYSNGMLRRFRMVK